MKFIDYLKPNRSDSNHENKIRKLKQSVFYEIDPLKKEKSLLTLEKLSKHDPVELHYTYNHLIEFCYKNREESVEALEQCIDYCQKDIDLYPVFIKAYTNQRIRELRKIQMLFKSDDDEYRRYEDSINKVLNSVPKVGMPSFKRLAIIYEKQGEFQEAISICEKAIEYDLTDDTKSGYIGRKQRLLKKWSSVNQ